MVCGTGSRPLAFVVRLVVVQQRQEKEIQMLYWAAVFLVIALVAGVLGFSGVAGASAGIAQILFFIFLVLLVVSLIAGLLRRNA
jgi:uncharacterized membrane protein YtjA (UPF0391 family)